jgi:transcription initiation factor IIE alpha subunit
MSETKTINDPDHWCTVCGNHELAVGGSESVLPIYTCTKCKNMMWPVDKSKLIAALNEEK